MGSEETRERILKAAIELFTERPYHEVSMEEVARKAGLSKGGLFHHFPSKYELARSVFLKLLDEWIKGLEERLNSLHGGEIVPVLVDASFKMITSSPKLSRFFLELYEESLKRGRSGDWDGFYRGYIDSVSEVLKRAGVREPEKKAILLGAIVDGLSLHHHLSGGRLFNVEEMKKEVLRIMEV